MASKSNRTFAGFRTALDWTVARIAFGAMAILKLLDVDRALGIADRFARRLGPKTSRHKLILHNLRRAFPEKTDAEISSLALESWGNMGRLAAEYVYLDAIYDLDPASAQAGRIEVTGREHLAELVANPRPFIFVASHSACFELIPIVAGAFGVSAAVLFRPPNNRFIAERIDKIRRARSGFLVPSRAGSSLTLARNLSHGGGIGVLVDQKFPKGLETTFFGLPSKTNPLVPKLARQFECDVFPVHCVRLPGNRYRIEVEPPLAVPLTDQGKADIDGLAQCLNDKVEAWVRRDPGQWLWYHDRWDIKRQIGL